MRSIISFACLAMVALAADSNTFLNPDTKVVRRYISNNGIPKELDIPSQMYIKGGEAIKSSNRLSRQSGTLEILLDYDLNQVLMQLKGSQNHAIYADKSTFVFTKTSDNTCSSIAFNFPNDELSYTCTSRSYLGLNKLEFSPNNYH